MGFNTPVLILNDRLDEIKNDPYFGPKLAFAINEFSSSPDYKQPYLTGQTQIINVAHADVLQVLAVGANHGRVIGSGHWTMDNKALIEQLYRQLKWDEKHHAATQSPGRSRG
jgi:hypothetical protein